MKHSHFFLSVLTLLSITFYVQSTVDQVFDIKLNTLQQAVANLIEQSNLDPAVAQDLLDKADELNHYVQDNIQQDIKEIRVAAGLTSILETIDKILQNSNQTDAHTLLSGFKYATRTNVIHKLIIGMYPGQFKNQPYYTEPYLESLGFIFNDWMFNGLLTALLAVVTPTTLGATLKLDSSSPIKRGLTRLAAGIAAHYAWLLQKKIALSQLNS